MVDTRIFAGGLPILSYAIFVGGEHARRRSRPLAGLRAGGSFFPRDYERLGRYTWCDNCGSGSLLAKVAIRQSKAYLFPSPREQFRKPYLARLTSRRAFTAVYLFPAVPAPGIDGSTLYYCDAADRRDLASATKSARAVALPVPSRPPSNAFYGLAAASQSAIRAGRTRNVSPFAWLRLRLALARSHASYGVGGGRPLEGPYPPSRNGPGCRPAQYRQVAVIVTLVGIAVNTTRKTRSLDAPRTRTERYSLNCLR